MAAYFLERDGDLWAARGWAAVEPRVGDGIHPIHGCAFNEDRGRGKLRARRDALCCLRARGAGACCLQHVRQGCAVAPEEPADKLYNEGLYLLNSKKDPKNAAKKFEEVDRQHPYSEWARKALIMSAFAYYQANAYDDCINTARRYVTLHPGSPDAAYAQFLIGSSYFDQMPEISRDQDRTEKAMQALDEVVRKYPNSEYAVAAKRKIEIARDQLAGKEMDIGRQNLNTARTTSVPSIASRSW